MGKNFLFFNEAACQVVTSFGAKVAPIVSLVVSTKKLKAMSVVNGEETEVHKMAPARLEAASEKGAVKSFIAKFMVEPSPELITASEAGNGTVFKYAFNYQALKDAFDFCAFGAGDVILEFEDSKKYATVKSSNADRRLNVKMVETPNAAQAKLEGEDLLEFNVQPNELVAEINSVGRFAENKALIVSVDDGGLTVLSTTSLGSIMGCAPVKISVTKVAGTYLEGYEAHEDGSFTAKEGMKPFTFLVPADVIQMLAAPSLSVTEGEKTYAVSIGFTPQMVAVKSTAPFVGGNLIAKLMDGAYANAYAQAIGKQVSTSVSGELAMIRGAKSHLTSLLGMVNTQAERLRKEVGVDAGIPVQFDVADGVALARFAGGYGQTAITLQGTCTASGKGNWWYDMSLICAAISAMNYDIVTLKFFENRVSVRGGYMKTKDDGKKVIVSGVEAIIVCAVKYSDEAQAKVQKALSDKLNGVEDETTEATEEA